MPLRLVLLPLARAVLPGLRGGYGELGDGGAIRQLLAFGIPADESDDRELTKVHVFLLSARFRWALPSEGWLLPKQVSAFFGGPQEFLSEAFASRQAVKDGNCRGGSDERRRSAGAGRRLFARSCQPSAAPHISSPPTEKRTSPESEHERSPPVRVLARLRSRPRHLLNHKRSFETTAAHRGRPCIPNGSAHRIRRTCTLTQEAQFLDACSGG